MPDFTLYDLLAALWSFAWWIGYTLFADHGPRQRHSISASMARYRHKWMEQMLKRQMRMVDTAIAGNLITGISFFASTTILVLVGFVALLGYSEQALQALSAIPFVEPSGAAVWETKVLLMLLIFVYAFFKFAWAFRLTNYCSILIGSAPDHGEPGAEKAAARAARMSMMSGHHFNRGIRAYFFALAALGWFLHPLVFAIASTWVVLVLYQREFRSHALDIL